MIPLRKPGPFQSLRRRLKKNKEARFEEQYAIGELLCRGSQGVVYQAYDISQPDRKLAVKIVERKSLNQQEEKQVFREVEIMRELEDLDHTNKLVDFFTTSKKIYIVQELAAGGDVLEWVIRNGAYSEKDARVFATKLLETIDAFHNRGVAHRDIKPENLLLGTKHNNTSIQVADWGFAARITDNKLTKKCGTPAYTAPEIIAGQPYDQSVDLWSAGCVIYLVLCARAAFHNKDPTELFRQIQTGSFKFYDKHNLSEEAKDFIQGLLNTDPQKRWTATEALNSAWIQGYKRDGTDLPPAQ